MADKGERLITIRKYPSYIQAEMAKQTLEDNGIRAVVSGENTANVYSLPGIQEAELQVLSDQADEALKLLKESE